MKHIDPDIYNEAHSGTLKWQNVKSFLRLDAWNDEHSSELYEQWWRYALEENIPDNEAWIGHIKSNLFRCSVPREKNLQIFCNYIDNLNIMILNRKR